MTKPIESNDQTQMGFCHPRPCVPFLGWAIFCRPEDAEMLLQVSYSFSITLVIHIQFIKPLFPEWIHLGFPEGHRVNLAFTGSAIFSSSEEGVFNPTKILPPGSFSVL